MPWQVRDQRLHTSPRATRLGERQIADVVPVAIQSGAAEGERRLDNPAALIDVICENVTKSKAISVAFEPPEGHYGVVPL